MSVQTYLHFDGRCEEALVYYRETLGAEVTAIIRAEDVPEAAARVGPRNQDAVLHSAFRIGGTTLLACDGMCGAALAFQGFGLTLGSASDEETERLFGLLADGGEVRTPLAPSFFSSRFGIVSDRFGVSWILLTTPTEVPAAT